MSKKNFKDNPALAFIGNLGAGKTDEVKPSTQPDTQAVSSDVVEIKKGHYRINLKLKTEYKTYLEVVSWKNKKSITQYINDLIEADKNKAVTKNG